MADPDVIRVMTALHKARIAGSPVANPSEAVARVVVRRWNSFASRRIQVSDRAARIDDLAKGLIAHMEHDAKLVGRLKVDYHYLAGVLADELAPTPESEGSPLLVEGYHADDLPDALGPELEADVLSGRALVARVGSAQILMALRIADRTLTAEIAHVDGGGEGVLPALISLVIRFAKRRHLSAIEWQVLAATCANPNPRLQPILERCGFVVRDFPGIGKSYWRQDLVRPEP